MKRIFLHYWQRSLSLMIFGKKNSLLAIRMRQVCVKIFEVISGSFLLGNMLTAPASFDEYFVSSPQDSISWLPLDTINFFFAFSPVDYYHYKKYSTRKYKKYSTATVQLRNTVQYKKYSTATRNTVTKSISHDNELKNIIMCMYLAIIIK